MAIVGEDYGEGSSIMQERTHAFAMKSQMWLLEPRPDLPLMVDMIEKGFQLSEATNTPIFYLVRVRGCHVTGEFVARDNIPPKYNKTHPVTPKREPEKIILPPYVYEHEVIKIAERWPQAVAFIKEHKLNEFFDGKHKDTGIIVQGGIYNTVIRSLQRLGLSDVYGNSDVPIYVLNVTYPLVDDEITGFCHDKKHVLLVEEGQPDYIEQNIHTILRKADIQTRIYGKDVLPLYGEYNGSVMIEGMSKFVDQAGLLGNNKESIKGKIFNIQPVLKQEEQELLNTNVPPRPSGLCTGCPERPMFSAIKQVQDEHGPFHINSDIGCHSFATLAPFNLGNTIMGYGLSLGSSSSIRHTLPHRAISIMGDGGFWHNGLSSGVATAVFNKHDGILFVINNGYSAATGGQDIPSIMEPRPGIAATVDLEKSPRVDQQPIEEACRGAGVEWIRTISTYDIQTMKDTLREALETKHEGLKVIVAEGECMLNRQRRIKPLMRNAITSGKRTIKARFYVDSETCTGDHACIRLSGCPSLTIKPNPDPLRKDPVSYVDNSCVGCGVCGENVHSAVLCPSFARVDMVYNPTTQDRFMEKLRGMVIGYLQAISEKRQKRYVL
jgi:indolepyruvate ferredoxin oxidoreductase alpha subunit